MATDGVRSSSQYPHLSTKGNRDTKRRSQPLGRIVTTYPYVDHAGALLYEVVRFDPKDFRQRRPKEGGGWHWNLGGISRVLYRLPHVAEMVAQRGFINPARRLAGSCAAGQ
jgi:hypothetical protein